MTNYEAMRTTMDKDELVEFLSSIMDGDAIRIMDKDELVEFLSSIVDCKKCDCTDGFHDNAYQEKRLVFANLRTF